VNILIFILAADPHFNFLAHGHYPKRQATVGSVKINVILLDRQLRENIFGAIRIESGPNLISILIYP
jgi:hypothetical protein